MFHRLEHNHAIHILFVLKPSDTNRNSLRMQRRLREREISIQFLQQSRPELCYRCIHLEISAFPKQSAAPQANPSKGVCILKSTSLPSPSVFFFLGHISEEPIKDDTVKSDQSRHIEYQTPSPDSSGK